MLRRMAVWALAGALIMSSGMISADEDTAPVQPAAEDKAIVISTDPADYALPAADFEFGIQKSEAVEHEYFDRTVFIGDSISLKLYQYVKQQRQNVPGFMGKAQFLVAGSLGSGNALWEISKESVHPSYRGKKMLLEDSVHEIAPEKVYIMLGVNDVTLYGTEGAVENMRTLIRRILDKTPGVEIYVQSATPKVAKVTSKPSNQSIFEYDLKLYQMCMEEGWNFVDVASVMRNEQGYLFDEYCSDAQTMGMHFTNEACQVWVDYLMTHAK